MKSFTDVYCIDGSGSKARGTHKRPIYRLQSASGRIERCVPEASTLSFFDILARASRPEAPVLLAVDVPLGLPLGFSEVYAGSAGFLEWLDARGSDADWSSLLAATTAAQTSKAPFVCTATKGDKARGIFPMRRCDALTNAESVYWCIGGKQVGRAALQFWFELLQPLRRAHAQVAVWPFDDLSNAAFVVAECYPGFLTPTTWRRRVVKTNPVEVVKAIASLAEEPTIAARTRLHAVSSEDEFDMFTTALAMRAALRAGRDLLAAPADAGPYEGWIALLEPP